MQILLDVRTTYLLFFIPMNSKWQARKRKQTKRSGKSIYLLIIIKHVVKLTCFSTHHSSLTPPSPGHLPPKCHQPQPVVPSISLDGHPIVRLPTSCLTLPLMGRPIPHRRSIHAHVSPRPHRKLAHGATCTVHPRRHLAHRHTLGLPAHGLDPARHVLVRKAAEHALAGGGVVGVGELLRLGFEAGHGCKGPTADRSSGAWAFGEGREEESVTWL